jgi:hypothetical protein
MVIKLEQSLKTKKEALSSFLSAKIISQDSHGFATKSSKDRAF